MVSLLIVPRLIASAISQALREPHVNLVSHLAAISPFPPPTLLPSLSRPLHPSQRGRTQARYVFPLEGLPSSKLLRVSLFLSEQIEPHEMADRKSKGNSKATEPSEPALDTLTWVEITKYSEQILARFENDETIFQRWEVKVVWEYWRGFEMMGLNPGVTVLKFMRDVVIPFASSRVHSRLQGFTRYEKATRADKSKTYRIETTVDEGPAIVYRKGSSPDTVTPAKTEETKTEEVHDAPKVVASSSSAVPKPDNQTIEWDLGAHMRANTAIRPPPTPRASNPSSPRIRYEHIEDVNQSPPSDPTSILANNDIRPRPSSPAPFHNAPIAQAAENILRSPISKSKLINQGPLIGNGFPAAVTSRVAGHPELIKVVCNGMEETVSTEDLVANNYLLRSAVESLNTTVTSMQAIIEAQKDRIDALSGYVASQHAKVRGLAEKLALSEQNDE